jgi:hypothetical protein
LIVNQENAGSTPVSSAIVASVAQTGAERWTLNPSGVSSTLTGGIKVLSNGVWCNALASESWELVASVQF